MSVLDPFEVNEIEVWPLPQFQQTNGKNADSKRHLNALERVITNKAIESSKFKSILNEKDPPPGTLEVEIPASSRASLFQPE